jgi:hypothetical protein
MAPGIRGQIHVASTNGDVFSSDDLVFRHFSVDEVDKGRL